MRPRGSEASSFRATGLDLPGRPAPILLQQHWPSGFEVAHNTGAQMFFYTVVFGLWVLWANYGGAESSTSSAESNEQAHRALA